MPQHRHLRCIPLGYPSVPCARRAKFLEMPRDVAASRARGMWMGGNVPLGYRVEARKLVVVEDEARLVQRIFAPIPHMTPLFAEARH